ncbi:MAG: histidine phosphatase family protein [Candidatus Staskawiczbacteria bacterium]|nr:histidine phosphatase family protein [Candidatus Staskawiczbacteria bacterium]
MRLIITRHGQTDENLGEIIIGQEADAMLNKHGIMQAQKLANFLKDEKINFAYVSSQKRAVHTANEILKFHSSVEIIVAHQLKEQNLGIYEAKSKVEWKKIKKNHKEPFHSFKPKDGESYVELQERIKEFFNDLVKKHKNDTVLMVSHGGTLGMLYLHILNKEITEENYKAHKPENTALTILDIYQEEPIKIHHLNSTDHLKHS